MRAGLTVKLCGMTNTADILQAARYGVDFAGVVIEADFSPRALSIRQAETVFLASPLPTVALVFNMGFDRLYHLVQRLIPYALQFLGPVNIELIRKCRKYFPHLALWQSLHLPPVGTTCDTKLIENSMAECHRNGINLFLLDTAITIEGKTRFGGTGKTLNWELAHSVIKISPLPVFLAGGINPDNVQQAINQVRPAGIDLCSGVEAFPGKKDPEKIKALMEGVKKAVDIK